MLDRRKSGEKTPERTNLGRTAYRLRREIMSLDNKDCRLFCALNDLWFSFVKLKVGYFYPNSNKNPWSWVRVRPFRLAHWYTFGSDVVLDIGRRRCMCTERKCPMTCFCVHLCATPWTAGQARRCRADRVIARPSSIASGQTESEIAPETRRTHGRPSGMNEWCQPLLQIGSS